MTYLLVCIHSSNQQRGLLHKSSPCKTKTLSNVKISLNIFFVWIHYCTNTSFLHSLQPSLVCAVTKMCCNALLIHFRWENQRMGSFTSNKKALQSHVSRLFFYDSFNHCLTVFPKTTRSVTCSFFFMLHICCFKALWCSEHSRGTQRYSNNAATLQSLLLFSKFICKQLSDWHSYLYQVKRSIKFWILCCVHADSGTQLIVRKTCAPLCHTDDLLALMEGKSSFRWSDVMLCLTMLCMHQ